MIIGYARASTTDQDTALQIDTLNAVLPAFELHLFRSTPGQAGKPLAQGLGHVV